MKNDLYEDRIRKAKSYVRNKQWRPTHPEKKIELIHCYDWNDPKEYQWWDDFKTKVGDQFLMIFFVHPRMTYKDACSDLAWDEAEKKFHYQEDSLNDAFIPIYTNVGKSRKKAKYYEMKERDPNTKDRYVYLCDAEKRILSDPNNGVFVRPSISIEQGNWAKFVEICVPAEFRKEDEMIEFIEKCQGYMTNRGNVNEWFGIDSEYSYSWKDWENEGHVV